MAEALIATYTHDSLTQLSTKDMMMALRTIEDLYAIAALLYEKECQAYRQGAEATPEAKIMFCIGDGKTNDLRRCVNFDGSPVRTKPAPLAKTPELFEIFAEVSAFLEEKPGVTADKLYSEIADAFYNLFHLVQIDSDFANSYSKWIDFLAGSLNLTTIQAGYLVAAKYCHRMYKNDGKNDFVGEDAEIQVVLEKIGVGSKTQISFFYETLNKVWNYCLKPRLLQLKGEYMRNMALMSLGLAHSDNGNGSNGNGSNGNGRKL